MNTCIFCVEAGVENPKEYSLPMHLVKHQIACKHKLAKERVAKAAYERANNIANVEIGNNQVQLGEDYEMEAVIDDDVPHEPESNPVPADQELNFDQSFEFCKLFTLCNQGRGLPDKDCQAFLDVLMYMKKHNIPMDLQYETLSALKKYRMGFGSEEDGFKLVYISVTNEDVEGLGDVIVQRPFHMKDMRRWLELEFVDKSLNDSFVTTAAPAFVDGQRVYNAPHQCNAWIEMQDLVRSRPGLDSAVIAALQLYSDKTLVNRKGLDVHPVKASLLNVPYSKRIERIISESSTVAYFDQLIDMPEGVPESLFRLVKLAYFSKALSALLEPMKRASHDGIDLVDPTGKLVHAYPRVLSYVMDLPESKDIYMVKGVPAPNPCEQCMVPYARLDKIFDEYPIRTVQQQMETCEEILNAPSKKARMDLIKKHSTWPVPCPLWGFADQDSDGPGCVMHALGFESLHNDDLGVFLYLIEYMKPYLEAKGYTKPRIGKIFADMNKRLESMPRSGMVILYMCWCVYF